MELKRKIETPKDKFMAIIGIICILYLLNPTMGLFELLPDRLPLFGNIDEAVITSILLYCLNYFGYNFTAFFQKK